MSFLPGIAILGHSRAAFEVLSLQLARTFILFYTFTLELDQTRRAEASFGALGVLRFSQHSMATAFLNCRTTSLVDKPIRTGHS